MGKLFGIFRIKRGEALPAAVAAPQKARDFLRNYVEGRLLMDLRMFSGIRLRMKLEELLYVLALHVGTEVSYDALARETGLNKMTVADYLALLEQCFIVKVCPSFARKLPNERRKGKNSIDSSRSPRAKTAPRCGKTSSIWSASSVIRCCARLSAKITLSLLERL